MASQPETIGADRERPATKARGPSNAVLISLAVVVVLAGAFALWASRQHAASGAPAALRASGIPGDVSTQTANLMGLSALPGHLASGFVLTDQRGRTMSLGSFKGHAVVLEFMDPHCTDICPIVSQEFVDAYHQLGAAASRVAFVAVNVNQYHASVAAMSSYSQAHELDAIPTWHFFTGPVGALKAVWHGYGVTVEAPNPNADIIHTSVVYFIDPQGREQFAAFPMADHTASGTAYLPANQITAWAQGISLVARQLAG